MVSLMPVIPLPSAPTTPIYHKNRQYTGQELGEFQFDPALLKIAQIRNEFKYYKDEKEYVGPRTVPNKTEGIRVLLIARSSYAIRSRHPPMPALMLRNWVAPG